MLFFFKQGVIDPAGAFRLNLSVELLVMVMLGGQGTVLGPVLGGALYQGLRGALLTSPIFKNVQLAVAGVLLLVIVLFIPAGAVGWLRRRFPSVAEGARMILQVADVGRTFGGLHALSNVTFDLPEGQILGLIGPNGAGKTTLFNCINGVFPPTTGQVIFRGQSTVGLPTYKVAHMGMARTHQIVRPLNDLTVRENVMVGACFGRYHHNQRAAGRIADKVIDQVGLAPRAPTPAGSLNIAQKKRLELARALAAEPFLLLLDEVLAGLNTSEVTTMVELIREIRHSGVTIIMIEHIMRAIMDLSDRLIVLNYGKVIAAGPPSEVAQNREVVEAYLGDPELAATLVEEG